MATLTKKQKAIYDFIKNYKDRKGFSPTFEEIKKHFRLSALSGVHQHIKILADKGFLTKSDGLARSIELNNNEQMVQIPLLGTIAAGQPLTLFETINENIAVPKSKLPNSGDVYALKVVGNSMIDENIHDGDTILVRHQNTAENGQKVVALVDGGATLKKFYKEKNQIRLQPANKKIESIIVRNDQDFHIQGVLHDVIETINKPVFQSPKIIDKKIEQYKKLPLNKIICGDAVKIMETMPTTSIDLVVTSPPYDELRDYKNYIFNFENIAKELFRIIKKGGVLVWVVGDKIKKGNKSLTSFRQALFFQNIGFNVHDIMIYKKKNTPFMRSNAYTNCFEFMFIFSKGSPKIFNPLKTKTIRQGKEMLPFNKKSDGINKKILKELKPEKTLTNIWEYAVGLHGSTSDKIAFQHTAIFPEKLAGDHILSWTEVGDVVFDPMCGSGTTCKMAAINKRHYIGCDISEEYVELTKNRLKSFKL